MTTTGGTMSHLPMAWRFALRAIAQHTYNRDVHWKHRDRLTRDLIREGYVVRTTGGLALTPKGRAAS